MITRTWRASRIRRTRFATSQVKACSGYPALVAVPVVLHGLRRPYPAYTSRLIWPQVGAVAAVVAGVEHDRARRRDGGDDAAADAADDPQRGAGDDTLAGGVVEVVRALGEHGDRVVVAAHDAGGVDDRVGRMLDVAVGVPTVLDGSFRQHGGDTEGIRLTAGARLRIVMHRPEQPRPHRRVVVHRAVEAHHAARSQLGAAPDAAHRRLRAHAGQVVVLLDPRQQVIASHLRVERPGGGVVRASDHRPRLAGHRPVHLPAHEQPGRDQRLGHRRAREQVPVGPGGPDLPGAQVQHRHSRPHAGRVRVGRRCVDPALQVAGRGAGCTRRRRRECEGCCKGTGESGDSNLPDHARYCDLRQVIGLPARA